MRSRSDNHVFPRELLAAGAMTAAPALLGAVLIRRSPDGLRAARIVETEAYTNDDPASHSFGRRTARNEPMFACAGTAYVYISYGIHRCLNIVTGEQGIGEAVLIRAIEPIEGVNLMTIARGWRGKDPRQLANGPGKVCQALGIGMELNGTEMLGGGGELSLEAGALKEGEAIAVSTRIGITRAADWPRRFLIQRPCSGP